MTLDGVRLVAFDLDDTLAPSKSPLPDEIRGLVAQLTQLVEVAVISGGALPQFQLQVIDALVEEPGARIDRLHLLPACGAQYVRWSTGDWNTVYSEPLPVSARRRVAVALEEEARALGYWRDDSWGPIIEDRGSQLTYSALGQLAPIDEKTRWDPDGAKRTRLRANVAARLPDFEVRAGGSTSVDVTGHGVDKGYGIRRLAEQTGIGLNEMLFFGDQLRPGGNDHAVADLGVWSIEVHSWRDTARELTGLLHTIPAGGTP